MIKPVTFFSEGRKLNGDLYVPDDLEASERRAGVLLCHGYTGVKDLYLPGMAYPVGSGAPRCGEIHS